MNTSIIAAIALALNGAAITYAQTAAPSKPASSESKLLFWGQVFHLTSQEKCEMKDLTLKDTPATASCANRFIDD